MDQPITDNSDINNRFSKLILLKNTYSNRVNWKNTLIYNLLITCTILVVNVTCAYTERGQAMVLDYYKLE
jgi:hypothetical protein